MTFTNEKNRERMLQFNTDNRMGNRFLSFQIFQQLPTMITIKS